MSLPGLLSLLRLLRLLRACGAGARGGVACPVCLGNNAGERVRHNIVHFAGDAGAFVLCGEAAFLFLLVFEAAGAFFELFAAQFAHAAGIAEEPEDGEDGSAEHAEH